MDKPIDLKTSLTMSTEDFDRCIASQIPPTPEEFAQGAVLMDDEFNSVTYLPIEGTVGWGGFAHPDKDFEYAPMTFSDLLGLMAKWGMKVDPLKKAEWIDAITAHPHFNG